MGIFDELDKKIKENEIVESGHIPNAISKEEAVSVYKLDFSEELDSETKDFLIEQTVKVHSVMGKAYTELGEIFYNAQEKLSQTSDGGVGTFVAWIEKLGHSQRSVYNYINRYKLILSHEEDRNKIEALPLKTAYEVARDIYPNDIKLKVINSEISYDELKEFSSKEKTVKKTPLKVDFEHFRQEAMYSIKKIEEVISDKKDKPITEEEIKVLKKISSLLEKL